MQNPTINKINSFRNKPIIKRLIFVSGLIFLILVTLLVISINPILKTTMPLAYDKSVSKYAKEYDINPALIYAVIKVESSFNPNAVSSADARGLMQITPDTFDTLKRKTKEDLPLEDLFDPDTCIRYGAYYLSMLIEQFENTDTALAAYNAGPYRISTWLKDEDLSDDGISLKHIPYFETSYYVKKVNNALDWYEKLYDFDN